MTDKEYLQAIVREAVEDVLYEFKSDLKRDAAARNQYDKMNAVGESFFAGYLNDREIIDAYCEGYLSDADIAEGFQNDIVSEAVLSYISEID